MVGLVRSACSELGAHGISVNYISPFGVSTPLACNLKGIVLKPALIAKAALFLASDEVNGGFTVVSHSYSTIQ
uniref:Uncharacterized protein n=1 Tax=Nelumbo nucifera TaxID=4432 RepID=A0A822ZLK6_NELNU|nr:TPA_asm: hypothetical protein HUJ06_004312 [Nelumbo nucifera]